LGYFVPPTSKPPNTAPLTTPITKAVPIDKCFAEVRAIDAVTFEIRFRLRLAFL
jgi:hypothetical protein